MIRALIVFYLAVPAFADLEHAKAKQAQRLPAGTLRSAFEVRVFDGGELQLASKQVVSLRELEHSLANARAAFDRKSGAAGKPLSELPVVLHVDRRAPWLHVQLVLAEAARVGCPRVWFAVDTGATPGGLRYLNAHLPMDLTTPGQDAAFLMVMLALRPTKIAERKWVDGRVVKQPTAISYDFDGFGTVGSTEAGALAGAMSALEGKRVVCRAVLDPAPPTPFRLVVEAMQVFNRAQYRSIEFVAPGRVDFLRNSRRLPYPSFDRLDPGIVHGIGDPVRRADEDPKSREFKGGAVDPGIRLPLASGGVPDRAPGREGRHVINLTNDGRIHVRDRQLSLRALLLFLAAEAYPDQAASPPRVLLRVDARAPWQHAMHILTALSRRGVPSVEIAVRRRADARDAARDALIFGVPRSDEAPDWSKYAAMFQLRLLRESRTKDLGDALAAVRSVRRDRLAMTAERMIDSNFGPQHAPARRPLNVRFDWNGKRTHSFRQLLRWIHEQRAAGMLRKGLIDSRTLRVVLAIDEKVPAGFVLASLARLQELGWRELFCFEPLEQEESAILEPLSLPYPSTNRPIRGDDGLGDTPVASSEGPSTESPSSESPSSERR